MNCKFRKFIAYLGIVFLVFSFSGCKTLFVKDPGKKAIKAQKKKTEEVEKFHKDATKRHYEIQDKPTEKRMKKKMRKVKKAHKKKMKKANKSKTKCN